jgi:hypothetical protein
MAEPERTCLRMQRAARAHPMKNRVAGDFRHQLIAE